MTTVHTISVQGTREDPVIVEETIVSEEKRTRKLNPYTAYTKAKDLADRARKAAVRAVDLADKARVASEKADALTALKDEAEQAEADAYDALQESLNALAGGVTVTVDYEGDE